MKSFGVRLGAGAVTILFGAYAAAIAQKDRQEESDSWTAEAPSQIEPASPIAEMADASWLHQPETDLGGQSDSSMAAAEPIEEGIFRPAGSVQLVQHTEPADQAEAEDAPAFGGPLPDSLGVSVQEESQGEDPETSWMLPDPSESPAAAPASGPAMSMSFPGLDANSAETAEAGTTSAAADGPDSGEPAGLTIADAPALEFYPAESGQGEPASSPGAGAAIASRGATIAGTDADAAGPPTNLLRGTPDGMNSLRGEGEAYSDAADSAAAIPSDQGTPTANVAESTSEVVDSPSLFAQPSVPGLQSHLGQPPANAESPVDPLAADGRGNDTMLAGQPTMDAATAGLGTPQAVGQSDPSADMRSGLPAGGNGSLGTGMPAQTNTLGSAAGFNTPNQFVQPGTAAGAVSSTGTSPQMAGLSRDAGGSLDGLGNGYQPSAMAQPGAAVAIDAAATLDSPGERRLEGAQTPSVVIQKRAPAEVRVGKPASFVVHVQNVGSVEALNVEVHDRVPAGMRLVDASPAPIQQGNLLMWELGAMPAGDERTITMQLIPEQEGELGSVARVSFEAAASVRTISTRPELKIVQQVPEQGVLIGQQLEIELEVSNPGSGAATGVVLQEDVPEGLEHPKGRQLDNALGTLAPGEVRRQVLRLRAVSPGVIENTIRLVADDGLVAEHTVAVQVVAPDLQIELAGPSKRFLERQATYQLNIANNGTADATNVEISVQLDRGFTFVSTDHEGQYDPSRHAVFWSLAQLPAGASGSVPLTLLPVETGEQAIQIEARADLGVIAKSERTMNVEGFAELTFAISNAGGPIEVGAETNYEIHVTNSGSKPDSNVRVQLQLPQGLELVSTNGDAGTDGRGLVAFQPKAQLAPGEELKYSLRVRGVSPGVHVVRAIVVSDQSTVPVTKEDSTRVYADQ
jgi:uncharacterized repeat protein (TIGR01451 family)